MSTEDLEVRRRGEVSPIVEGAELAWIYFDSGRIVLAASTLAPGARSTRDPGHPGAHEVGYCVSGRFVLEVGGSERRFVEVNAGDAVLIGDGIPHIVHNPGPEQAEMVWAAAPSLGRPIIYDGM